MSLAWVPVAAMWVLLLGLAVVTELFAVEALSSRNDFYGDRGWKTIAITVFGFLTILACTIVLLAIWLTGQIGTYA